MSNAPDTWKTDFIRAFGLLVVGSLVGFVWNPSALRNSEISIDSQSETANYLTELDQYEVLRGLKSGTLSVVDCRQRSFYEAGHIPGSLPVWDAKIEFMIQILYRLIPLQTQVIIVDQESSGFGGKRIAGLFASRGYKDVKLLQGGLSSWRSHGLPLIRGWDFDEIKAWGKGK